MYECFIRDVKRGCFSSVHIHAQMSSSDINSLKSGFISYRLANLIRNGWKECRRNAVALCFDNISLRINAYNFIVNDIISEATCL